MFYVINKEKVTAYIVSVFTVVFLFVMAGVLNPKDNVVETSVEAQNEVKINSEKINNDINTNKTKIDE